MEYESRKVKWYWLVLFIAYSGAAAYVLFQGNPYLYSHIELRSALMEGAEAQLQTIPSEPSAPSKTGAATFFSRYSFERTAVDPISATRSKNYVEYQTHKVETGLENWTPEHIAYDSTGFYITGKSPWAIAVSLEDGKARWKYKFARPVGEKGLYAPLLDDANVYLVHPTGEVAALDKITGEIRWLLPVNFEVVAQPFLWQSQLVMPVKAEKGLQLLIIQRAKGQREEVLPRLEIKPGFSLSRVSSLNKLVATVDNKVHMIDPSNWTVEWSQTLTEPILGPATVVDSSLFVATLGGKIIRLDASKKGKLDWEVDLEQPSASPPAFLPITNRLSFLDSEGALVVIDAKTGKGLWRYNIENKSELKETWSARLKGNHIEEFKMDWLHKGWTIWSPCGERRFCVFTPNKGQMIERIQLSGEPLTLPLALERRWIFFAKAKSGQFLISHVLEEGEIKALQKAAVEAKSEPPPEGR